MFEGSATPQNQFHDFHAPIAPNNLYWVIVIPDGALKVSTDGRQASLEMSHVPIIDQPRWPSRDTPTMPAIMSFRIEWSATDEPASYEDPVKQFRFKGWVANTRLEASIEVPSQQFTWRSDPLDKSSASFGVIGEEANGRYFQA